MIDMIRSEEQREPSQKEDKGKEVMWADVGAGKTMETAVDEEEPGLSGPLLPQLQPCGSIRYGCPALGL